MKIAIVGSGNMGAALGTLWAQNGHHVIFSYSKDREKLERLAAFNENTAMGNVEEAIISSEVVMLSVPYTSLKDVIRNEKIFRNKIVITCVSGLQPDITGETIGLPTTHTISVAEVIASALPGASVIEAFNTTFAEVLQIPARIDNSIKPSLFYCGDDIAAKKIINGLIEDCGYTPVNAGNLRTARTMETFATSWVQFAIVAGLFPRIGLRSIQY